MWMVIVGTSESNGGGDDGDNRNSAFLDLFKDQIAVEGLQNLDETSMYVFTSKENRTQEDEVKEETNQTNGTLQ